MSDKIKELRKAKGLSQAALGKAIGYSHAVVGFWESGDRVPAADALKKLAVYFEVTADYLLGLEREDGSKITIAGNNSGVINTGSISGGVSINNGGGKRSR